MPDEYDRILELPPDEFGAALGDYLRRFWRDSRNEGRLELARLQRQWRMEAAERRRIRLQRLFLQEHVKAIKAAVHHHDVRAPRRLFIVSKGLRRAVMRRTRLVD